MFRVDFNVTWCLRDDVCIGSKHCEHSDEINSLKEPLLTHDVKARIIRITNLLTYSRLVLYSVFTYLFVFDKKKNTL